MSSPALGIGALGLLLIHQETGCPHSAAHAARLLNELSNTDEIDLELRQLCERAADRLLQKENTHACPAKRPQHS